MQMKYKLLIVIGIIAVLAIIQNVFSASLDLMHLRTIIESYGSLAPVIFMVLYIVLTLFLFPSSLASIFGGVLFGKWFGTVYVSTAATIAAVIGFGIARKFGKGISKAIEQSGNKLIGKIRKELQHHGFRGFVIIRSLFLPYMPTSYAAGLIKQVTLGDFFWATFLTNICYGFFFVLVGDQLAQGWKAAILPAIMIMMVLLIPRVIKHVRRKRGGDADEI